MRNGDMARKNIKERLIGIYSTTTTTTTTKKKKKKKERRAPVVLLKGIVENPVLMLPLAPDFLPPHGKTRIFHRQPQANSRSQREIKSLGMLLVSEYVLQKINSIKIQ